MPKPNIEIGFHNWWSVLLKGLYVEVFIKNVLTIANALKQHYCENNYETFARNGYKIRS
jgi:hypothetical protein